MDRSELFIDLLKKYFDGHLSRSEIENVILDELLPDSYSEDRMLNSCEEALRHINEPYYWTMDGELKYFLECLDSVVMR